MKRAILSICVIFILAGCYSSPIEKADVYSKESENLYQLAVSEYKNAIESKKSDTWARFKLGSLYYFHGEYKSAIDILEGLGSQESNRVLAISYYKNGDYTKGLAIFDRMQNLKDAEFFYYYALTCEKLNLYDQALGIYKKIRDVKFMKLATDRINAIQVISQELHLGEGDKFLNELIKNSGAKEDYPQAGAVMLLVDEEVQLTKDNKAIFTLHMIAKILNDRGKNDFSEIEIGYDSTYETVELEYARTIKPDGSFVWVGDKNIRDVSKYLNFPLYSNARARIISMPELEDGAIVEYKTKITRNKLIAGDNFVMNYRLYEKEPIEKAKFNIIVENGKKFNIKIINKEYNKGDFDLEPKITQQNDKTIYTVELANIPQLMPEADMVAASWVNPGILFSTFSSWDDIYNWWWPLAKDKIILDRSIKQKVQELIRDKKTEEEKIRAICHYCGSEIRYVAVSYGAAGYEPHSATEIFQNKYGDCKDQTILLITMLKEAGINAYPVLIPTKDLVNLDEDFPFMYFNHAIAAIRLDKDLIFFDPTAETCAFRDLPEGDQDRRVLVIKEDALEIQKTPLYPEGHNISELDVNIEIKTDEGIFAKRNVVTSGAYAQGQRYWLKYTPPQFIHDALEARIQDFAIGAKLLNYDVKNLEDLSLPSNLTYEFQGNHFLTRSGPARIMPSLSGISTSLVSRETREYPIDMGIPGISRIKMAIKLPSNFSVRYLPSSVTKESKWLSFKNEYKVNDGVLYFMQQQSNKATEVAVEEYKEFKAFLEGLAKDIDQAVILEKTVE